MPEFDPLRGKWTDINRSQALSHYRYNPETRWLDIRFHNGHIGRYRDVPDDVVLQFVNANSMGRFLQSQLKDAGYEYEDITKQETEGNEQP